jgi:radical SAM protein with 4Fe4S-binding SPASM domain
LNHNKSLASPSSDHQHDPYTLSIFDPEIHYWKSVGPIEHPDLNECEMAIENIGWTLGNDCPYRCFHCYSMSARRKGMNLEPWMVDRVVEQLVRLGTKTVNLGGNEPIFTNGLDIKASLMPRIIESLVEHDIAVGLTTSGITLLKLEEHFPHTIALLNDIDISLDSPYPEEHNKNRGAILYSMVIECLELCCQRGIDHTLIMCAMRWNFSPEHVDRLIDLARRYDAHVRINALKPVQLQHMDMILDVDTFYEGFSRLLNSCNQIDLGEPLLAAATGHPGKGCPCGRTSFRIHSITPEGRIPVSPCVYLHDYKVGDLLVDDIFDIVTSPQFRSFRRRNANPEVIEGCKDCHYLAICRGGCAARSYLHNLFENQARSLFVQDPYCLQEYEKHLINGGAPYPQNPVLSVDKLMVHRDYLCTWIGKPLSLLERPVASAFTSGAQDDCLSNP